jgi:hypothetical protein
MKEDEIGRSCRMHERENCIQDFGKKNWNKKDHWEDLGADERINQICMNKWEGVDWIHPAQRGDRHRALVPR